MIKNIYAYFNHKNLKTKIILFFVVFAIIFFSLILLVMYNTYYEASMDQIEIASNSLLESFSYKYAAFADGIKELIFQIINDEEIYDSLILLSRDSTDISSYEKVISDLNVYLTDNMRISSVRIYLKDTEICVDRNGHQIIYDNLYNEEYIKSAIQYEDQIVTVPSRQVIYQSKILLNKQQVIYSYTYNKSIVSFGTWIHNDNEDIGIILIDFEENYIANLQRLSNLTKNNFFVLSNSEGDVITSLSKDYVGKNLFDIFDNYPYQYYFPSQFYVNIKGEKYFVSHSNYWRYDWELFSFIPVSEILFNQSIFMGSIAVLLAAFIILIIILTYILTKTITKPTYKIINALEQLKLGNFSSRIRIERNDEFGKISEMFNYMSNNLQTLIKENYEIELKEKEAELKFLQSQINPHFLYNTLETIKWKVISNKDDADILLTSLGKLVRYNFKNPSEMVTLEKEIEQLENYLFIQQARYEGRFKINYKFHQDVLHLKIHKFIIQPIVENSIIHGLEQKEENGLLCISGKTDNGCLVITVYDNGCGIEEQRIEEILKLESQNNSIGFSNVHKRIQYYYGKEYGLKIISKVDVFTKTIIKLPIIQ